MTLDLLDPARASSGAHDLMTSDELQTLLHRAVPELAVGLWSMRDARALVTLPRGSQRFTACVLTWEDHSRGRTDCAELVVKEDRKRMPRWADRAARLLVGAGFGPGSQSQVAAPYGVCGPGVLVSERVAGLSLLTLLRNAPTATAAAVLAERALQCQAGHKVPSSATKGNRQPRRGCLHPAPSTQGQTHKLFALHAHGCCQRAD